LRSTLGALALLGGAEIKRNRYLNLTSAKVAYRNSPAGSVTPEGMVMGDDKTTEAGYALYGEAKWSPAAEWTGTANLRLDRMALEYDALPVAGNGSMPFRVEREGFS
jgi:outer membrane receptor protein involved in Fe transport